MLIAVAAMASVSCQKEEAQAPVEPKSTTITLKADVVDTKTYITEGNAVLWGTGEYVQLYFNNGTDDPQFVKSNDKNANEWNTSDEAMFSFDITYNPADSYTLGGVYPASVVADSNTDANNYKVILPSTQNASSTSYDPAAFIMIMKPETIADADFDKDEHIASFRRAVALNKITLTGVKEAINSVAITAEGKDLAGRRKFNLTTGAEGEIYYGQTSTITVNATYAAGDIDVWFTSWGAEIVEGETLKVVLKSETKTYEKTITARTEGIKFVEGGLNKLTIDMSSIEGATSAVALPFVEDFAAITSGSNTTTNSSTVVTDAMMSQFSSYASATYQADGAVRIGRSGSLITKELDLSKDFHVIVSAKGWSASELLLTVTAGSQVNDIELTTYREGDFVDYIINFDAIDNSEVVKFTTTSNERCFIDKIQILEGYAELPSVLTAENPEIMAAAGGAGSFAYTLTNPKEGQELTATTDAEWITDITVNEGTVSYTVDENTVEESRETTITLKYEGVDDVTVTVAQAGYVDTNFEAGQYWIMATEEGKTKVLTPLADGLSYGYGPSTDVTDNRSYAKNAFTFTEVVGGFTIQDASGKYYYSDATHTSFQLTTDSSTEGIVWSVTVQNDGTYVLTNVATERTMKYGDGTYTTFGVYLESDADTGVYPTLVKADNPLSVELSSISVSGHKTSFTEGDSFEFGGTVTATYTDDSTKDVTANVSVTEPNMEDGAKVTVSYTEGTITKTFEYTISVKAEGAEVVPGNSYTYTFSAKQWAANGVKTLNSLSWTLAGDGNYWGYDATKGQQFGSGNAPYKSMTLSTSNYEGGVEKIVINTSGATSIAGSLVVTVGGVQYGSKVTLTKTATSYTFEAPDTGMQQGEIVLTYTQTSSKAIYIKSISINN